MLTVTNELTGETFETESLRKAQAYRDAHEDGVVAIHTGVVLIGESSGRFMLRKSAAGRTVRPLPNRRSEVITKADIENSEGLCAKLLEVRRRQTIFKRNRGSRVRHLCGLLKAERQRDTVAAARSRRHWPITAMEFWLTSVILPAYWDLHVQPRLTKEVIL